MPARPIYGYTMALEHLVSTMNRSDFDFITEKMNCRCDVVTVNQNVSENREAFSSDGISILAVSTPEKGLSNSRNKLLDNARGDIEILGDDDLTYREGYQEIVTRAYESHPDADIIVFQYAKPPTVDRPHNPVMKEEGRVDWLHVSRVRSVEVTLKRKSIEQAGLRFDNDFGLGSEYQTGEENIFIADALRAGLKVYYFPAIICTTPPTPEERKKFAEGFTPSFFKCKGACFYRIYKNKYRFFAIAYLLNKRKTVLKNISFFSALKYMDSGRKEYIAAEKRKK